MAGIVGKSGRKKKISTIISEAVTNIDRNLPQLFEALMYKALLEVNVKCPNCKHSFNIPGEGDKEALIYLIDRRLGKPKMQLNLEAKETLSAGLVVKLFQLLAEQENELESSRLSLSEPDKVHVLSVSEVVEPE